MVVLVHFHMLKYSKSRRDHILQKKANVRKSIIKFWVFRVKKQSVILFTMIYVSSHAMHTKVCVLSVDDERQMFFDCGWLLFISLLLL